jgi:hypothetical protein
VKYYLDEDLSPKIAALLRKKGVDCVSAHEIEMVQASDLEQLHSHYGVLIIPSTIPGDKFSFIANVLARYAKKHPEGIQPYTIDFLPSSKL